MVTDSLIDNRYRAQSVRVCLHVPSRSPSLCPSQSCQIYIVWMVTDCLTDRLGSEPTLSIKPSVPIGTMLNSEGDGDGTCEQAYELIWEGRFRFPVYINEAHVLISSYPTKSLPLDQEWRFCSACVGSTSLLYQRCRRHPHHHYQNYPRHRSVQLGQWSTYSAWVQVTGTLSAWRRGTGPRAAFWDSVWYYFVLVA